MNGLVRELSRELARESIEYVRWKVGGDALAACLEDQELAERLFARATAWLDGQDVQGLMLKVLAKRW